MYACKDVTKEMLPNRIEVSADPGSLDYASAKTIADSKAKEIVSDPMLVAWFERKTGMFSPNTFCCDSEKPSWLEYAESRGADLSVDINGLDYLFVYHRGGEEIIH